VSDCGNYCDYYLHVLKSPLYQISLNIEKIINQQIERSLEQVFLSNTQAMLDIAS